jgi:dephospho-CoA kinase
MFKKLRELMNSSAKLEKIESHLDQMQIQITQIASIKKSTKYREIVIEDVEDFDDLKDIFEEKIRKEIKDKYDHISDNFIECVLLYDKLLYYNRDTINYIDLTYKIIELKVLRDLITSKLHINNYTDETEESSSFYLYMIDNFYLNETLKKLPGIDISKVFVINSDSDIDVEKYALIDIQKDKIVLLSAGNYFEFENKYRKTVIRVMYSIYRERYYLYHLQDGKERKYNG